MGFWRCDSQETIKECGMQNIVDEEAYKQLVRVDVAMR